MSSRRKDRHGGAAAPAADALTDLACACATARQVARLLTQLYDGRLRSTGIEAPQFALMMTLEKQGPCSQAEVGRRYAIDKTTLSRNLRVLQRNGWIEAAPAEDLRHRRFTLTPEGRRRLAAARPEWMRAQAQLRASMTPKQWAAMFAAFKTASRAASALQARTDQKASSR